MSAVSLVVCTVLALPFSVPKHPRPQYFNAFFLSTPDICNIMFIWCFFGRLFVNLRRIGADHNGASFLADYIVHKNGCAASAAFRGPKEVNDE